ncbi:ATP-dependent helicase [Nocardioides mesophilus]|uniref:DNA 3'-5' helicase n=2 Tax=Nocardioides mesophilus TaxID=433659 RepID=A0A7G9RHJ3_9ACTN|nr:ATP-dependent helicase [Nocardioides mesophilus]
MRAPYPPSDEQFAAITAPLEPAVVIAGAGSGKTTVMAARVVYLVATGQVTPDQVLGLTFTTKAASELATRVRTALRDAGILRPPGPRDPRDPGGPGEPEEPEEPTVATYNAYAAALLTEHGLRIGHEPDTRVIADASRYQLAARAIARYTKPVELLSDHPETVIGYVLALEGAMSEHLVGIEQVRELQRTERALFVEALATSRAKKKLTDVLNAIDRREELLGLVAAYRRLKRDLGLMDFSDQIALGARLAVERAEVGVAERDKFRVVLLDEYQDTSVAQATMLSRLFSGPDPESGRGHPVTAVGDPNQAIYGWRGASVSNILNYGDDFPTVTGSTEVPSYPLTINRRSEQRILGVANRLAGPLYAAFPQVQPLRPSPTAGDGQVRAVVHESYPEELAWLPGQVVKAHANLAEPAWSSIGVLVRDNAHAADVFDALTREAIPVEIVGLQGLLRLPEVAEVVATLTLLHDLTANAAVLTLLTGPRWSVGPRDLALLGRRAAHLSGPSGRAGRDLDRDVATELAAAVGGSDPTEVVSLSDALDDPGTGERWSYSPEARERFGLLAGELRHLRSYASEPLLDLVRRIVDTTGIDVELASSVSPAAQARRENLDLFVKAVADFQAVDGAVTLPALLAYLQTEDDLGNGLDVATPTEADSVKLLTVHRAKGLEWDTVFLVGVVDGKFPTTRGRPKWTSGPAVLPTALRGDARDLPVLAGHTSADLDAVAEEWKRHEAREELRLGYVAFTRAKRVLVVSSYLWGPTQQKPLGPSPYQVVVRECLEEWGGAAEQWLPMPEDGATNPVRAGGEPAPWPVPEHTAEVRRRLEAAARVRTAMARLEAGEPQLDEGLDVLEAARVAQWDDETERLLEEARRARAADIEVPLPSSLSATALSALRRDPDAFATTLARPMPRQPSPSARFGTRFHAWVEARFGQQLLLDPDELPGRADAGIEDDADLQELIARFEAGPFADRVPAEIEPPFALVLAGQVVRGRIDAVYREPDDDGGERWLVVDWKTNRQQTADPLQLAIYRLAWAELRGIAADRVRAGFYYVRSGELVEHDGLEGRAELEQILVGGG